MTGVVYAHIDFARNGVPFISGTQTKVEEVVLDHLAHNWDASEINRQYPDLSLAEVHSALAYYYDHQGEMDGEIEKGLRQISDSQAGLGQSSVRIKLRAKGLLP